MVAGICVKNGRTTMRLGGHRGGKPNAQPCRIGAGRRPFLLRAVLVRVYLDCQGTDTIKKAPDISRTLCDVSAYEKTVSITF